MAGRLVQTFEFDKQFLPSGYSINLTPAREGSPISISCRLEIGTLSCDMEFEGKKSSTSAKVDRPCVVALDEAVGLDSPWAFGEMLRFLDAHKHPMAVDLCVLKEKSLGQISVEVESDSKVDQPVFAGEETTEVLGKSQAVRKYELRVPLPVRKNESAGYEAWVIRVLPNGLVASVHVEGLPGNTFELTEYKEYAKWGGSNVEH